MTAAGVNPSVPNAPYTYGYDNGGRLTSLQNPFSETTGYAYNADDTLAKKTLANGASISYGYDAADQMTGLSYVFGSTTYSHRYTYTPAGELATRYEDDGSTNTFGYDGADQLVSEVRTGPVPFNTAYTYDHNGNRLTQTQNGSQTQSFTYDAHDKLTSGTAGNETPGYDKNGNETSLSISGTQIAFAYDDEDRLTQFTSSGAADSFVYNGLGLRVGKTDSSGTYAYVCDGTSPGSPVLSDGHALYTPGLSESRGGVSAYYSNDRLGNLWTLDGSSKNQLTYEDYSGFGTWTSGASGGVVFGYGGGNGCQSDADTGLVLMGHRYYDPRMGRFISQDPAGDGDNWYAYAGNDPVDETDPSGLFQTPEQQTADAWLAYTSSDYSGQKISYDSWGGAQFTAADGTVENFLSPSDSMFSPQSAGDPQASGGPSMLQDIGSGFAVGGSAAGSQLLNSGMFHLWDGGAAKHDPSFATSSALAGAGVMAASFITGGGEAKAAEETMTVSRWGRSGLEAGDWVMKGKASWWNYLRSFKWQPGFGNKFSSFELGKEFEVPSSSVKWPTGAGIDGWWKGLFGQRVYKP